MYIQESVIKKYKELVNPVKIEGLTERELLWKINRDLDLGKRVYTKQNGEYLVQYFDLVYTICGFRCVSVYRDKFNKRVIVPKEVKQKYYQELMEEIA